MQWLTVQGAQIVGEAGAPVLLRGVGLGGWLNPENFITGYPGTDRHQREALARALGRARAERFRDALEVAFFGEADAEWLAGQGLNLLRLPVHYRHFEDDASPFVLKDGAFDQLDRVVDVCARHGIHTIIDLHAVPGWQNQDWHSDNPTHVATFWDHPHFQDRVVWLWQQLAAHYADNPAVAGYNPLNEPADPTGQRLGPFYARLEQAIRGIDPRHILFLDGNRYSTEFDLFTEPFENAVYTVHDYQLPGFAGGGPYPGLTHGQYVDRDVVRRTFLQRTEFMRSTGTPIWVGEFGPVYTGDPARDTMRRQLLEDQLAIYTEHQAHWAIWTFKDIGTQGLLVVEAESPWRRLLAPLTAHKAQLGADSWGATDPAYGGLVDSIVDLLAEHAPDFVPYPHGRGWLVQRLVRQILFAEALAPEYERLFAGLSDADLEGLADSFSFAQCRPDAALTALVSSAARAG